MHENARPRTNNRPAGGRTLRISIVGYRGTFAWNQIGGTDSFFRRIGAELAGRGHEVAFIHYGYNRQRTYSTMTGITVYEHHGFADALYHLEACDGSVLVNAIRAVDRPAFIRFRRRLRGSRRFLMVYSYFAETRSGRLKHFLEATIYPYNAGCICMSARLAQCLRHRRNRAYVILPPAPAEYFRCESEKRTGGKLVVAYIGRLEAGKGAPEAVAILEKLSRDSYVEPRVLAYRCDETQESRALRDRIAAHPNIRYQQRAHRDWTPELQTTMARELAETDILLLPYRRVSSSIDTPLLLLEAMASLCCCIVRADGDIRRIYGTSPFLIEARSDSDLVDQACELIRAGRRDLVRRERARLVEHRLRLEFDTASVTDKLIEILRQAR